MQVGAHATRCSHIKMEVRYMERLSVSRATPDPMGGPGAGRNGQVKVLLHRGRNLGDTLRSPRCFGKLVTMLRREGADAVRRGRP